MPGNVNHKLVEKLLKDDSSDLEREQIIEALLKKKLSRQESFDTGENATFGNRVADAITTFAGSWTFILIFLGVLILWMIVNALVLTRAFDPYPFILLNLVLSCVAAIQAPIILMSQNRQEERDRIRANNDYWVNLKSEIIIEDLHEKLDALQKNHEEMLKLLEEKQR